jgi:hypothetical protein
MMNHASEKNKRGSLCVEVSNVMEKDKWMFNIWNQASHKESHISKCHSLLNQDISDMEIKSGNGSYGVKDSKSHPLRVNAKEISIVKTLMKFKKE